MDDTTLDLLDRCQRARDFAMAEAGRLADELALALADVRNEKAFVRMDCLELIRRATRLGELQSQVIDRNRSIRRLGDKAVKEAGR